MTSEAEGFKSSKGEVKILSRITSSEKRAGSRRREWQKNSIKINIYKNT